jgi:hypothetical protein
MDLGNGGVALEVPVLQPIDRKRERSYSCSMLKTGLGSNVPLRSLLLFAVAILAPAMARADDFTWAGDSGCSDPPIFSDIFTLPATNSHGGLCRAFGNHTGHSLNSLTFTAAYPSVNPDFFCSAAPYFTDCDFNVDGTIYHNGDTPPSFPTTGGHTITVEFFGLNSDRHGIPVDTVTGCTDTSTDPACYNFYINLNSYLDLNGRPCTPFTRGCTQPTGTTGSGDWAGTTFAGAANVPEPRSGALILTVLGVFLARIRAARSQRHQRH